MENPLINDHFVGGVPPVQPPVAIPVTAPVVPAVPVIPTIPAVPRSRSYRTLFIVIGVVLVACVLAGTAYAYIEKMGPFSNSPYSEKDLMSGLVKKGSQMQTATYQASAVIVVEPREADAKPFAVVTSNQAELEKLYKNDAKRASDAECITTELRYSIRARKSTYPSSLAAIAPKVEKCYSSNNGKPSINDPVTKTPYGYSTTDGGKNYALTIAFETKDAISTIKKGYSYVATTTLINGQAVTFTKDGSFYIYLPSKPPKPFFVQLQEMASYMPAELAASLSFGATTDFTKADAAGWKFNVDATGDFGDANYKINAEALQKDGVYYFRINNIPSILGSLAAYKGMWIKVDPTAASSTSSSFDELAYAARQLPEAEKSFKQNRNQATELLAKAASIADEEGLISFKKAPYAERVDGRLLYHYDIEFKKEAILPFYKRLVVEAQKVATSTAGEFLDDQGMVEYLQSKEFSDVFDYYQSNTALILWADPAGYPAIIEYTLRFVPPDTATLLKSKQAKLTFKLVFSNINQPVDIQAPADAKTVESLLGPSISLAKTKSDDARTQANLSSVMVAAELYYNDHSSYGSAGKTKDACTGSDAPALFKDTKNSMAKTLEGVTSTKGCNVSANGKTYAVWAALTEEGKGYWCVDSTGRSGSVSTAPASGSTVCP